MADSSAIVRWWMVRPVVGGAHTHGGSRAGRTAEGGTDSGTAAGSGAGAVISWIAVIAAALLMAASAAIHIHLWDIAYRHVATLGPLFMVQAIAALVGAVVLVALRWTVVAIGCIALMIGTVIGFVLADTVGIFGFKLPVVTSWAYEALVTELLAALLLVGLVVRSWLLERNRPSSASAAQGSGSERVGVAGT